MGLSRQGQVSAARLPFGRAHRLVGLERRGVALRRPCEARALYTDEVLPTNDGERAGRAWQSYGGDCVSTQAAFTLRSRNPDVLTCIANLSNDEVFTPPEFANRMLDTLAEAWATDHSGANIWADSSVRFLDPCTKSGVFLREITSRLTKGLADEMPD